MATLLKLEIQPGHQKNVNDDGTVDYNIKYVALFDGPVSDAFEADLTAGLSKGAPLSFAPTLTLQDYTTKETDSPSIWEFDCTYKSTTTDSGGGGGGGGVDDSLTIEPFSWTETREVLVKNTAGDPMFPPLQETEYWPGIKVIWNDVSVDVGDYEIGGAVNDVAQTVAGVDVPIYCMKAGALEFRKRTDGATVTWSKALPLYFCFKKARGAGTGHVAGATIGFQKEIISNGYRVKTLTGYKNILNENGEEITQPARINALGTLMLTDAEPDHSILVVPSELDDFSDFDLPTGSPS